MKNEHSVGFFVAVTWIMLLLGVLAILDKSN